MTFQLSETLVASWDEDQHLRPTLYSSGRARGSYHPMRFVLRLRPDVHRALESLETEPKSLENISAEQIQAFSTYFHETVHWWQHIGSTLGLVLSLLNPAQTHLNKRNLDQILKVSGPFKSLRKYDQTTFDTGNSREDINVALNNWHDIELFRDLAVDPKVASSSILSPYFDCVAHSYQMALASVLWLLSATFEPELQVLPDPRKWEPEFQRLRSLRQQGFYRGSDVYLPPLGARDLFEGQARFSQIQYLYAASGARLTWDDCKAMLRGVYREAFDTFLTIVGASWPDTPGSPIKKLAPGSPAYAVSLVFSEKRPPNPKFDRIYPVIRNLPARSHPLQRPRMWLNARSPWTRNGHAPAPYVPSWVPGSRGLGVRLGVVSSAARSPSQCFPQSRPAIGW